LLESWCGDRVGPRWPVLHDLTIQNDGWTNKDGDLQVIDLNCADNLVNCQVYGGTTMNVFFFGMVDLSLGRMTVDTPVLSQWKAKFHSWNWDELGWSPTIHSQGTWIWLKLQTRVLSQCHSKLSGKSVVAWTMQPCGKINVMSHDACSVWKWWY
jgi:hypothetical protein